MSGFVRRPASFENDLDQDWTVVACSAIALIFSVGTLTVYSLGVFVRPLAQEFSWNRTQLSGTVTIAQYAFAMAGPLWGWLTDRYGPRATTLPSVIVLSILVSSLALLTPNLWHLYLVSGAVSMLAGGASPLAYSAVLVRRFDRKLGQALGLALMGVGIGATIIPIISQTLVGTFGWREAYLVLGVLTLLITFPAALRATRDVRGPARISGKSADVMSLVSTRPFILMCAAFFLLGAVSIGSLAHLVPMMIDRGLNPSTAAQIASLTGLATVVGRGGSGWVLDRVHAPHVLVGVAIFAIAAFLLLAYGDTAASGYLAAILLGSVVGAEVDFISFLVRRYFGQVAFGRLYSIAFGFFIVGNGTGPLVLGASFDRLGGYRPGLLIFVGLCIIIILLSLALPRYSTPKKQEPIGTGEVTS